MKQNDITTLDKLKVGDRFYKAGDKSRIVYEVALVNTSIMGVVAQVQIYKTDKWGYPLHPVWKKSPAEIQVIFLRHNEKGTPASVPQ